MKSLLWCLPVPDTFQIGPQIRKLRTQDFGLWIEPIFYRKYLRICGKKLKSTANPQSNNIAGIVFLRLPKKYVFTNQCINRFGWMYS